MVALVFGKRSCVVPLVLTNGDCLRRSGFPAAEIGGAGKYAPARAFLGHAHHGVLDLFDIFRLKPQTDRRCSRRRFLRLSQRILQAQRQPWLDAGTSIDQGG